jgi:hypothetical protein
MTVRDGFDHDGMDSCVHIEIACDGTIARIEPLDDGREITAAKECECGFGGWPCANERILISPPTPESDGN